METIITSFLTAFLTASLTVIFAFWGFQSEKWWKLKAETYRKIIELLHQLKRFVEHRYQYDLDQDISRIPDHPHHPPRRA